MNIIKRVEIIGLWHSHDLQFDVYPDVNFLIGINGTGKTTVIRLIIAALAVDFPTLSKLPFKSLVIAISQPHAEEVMWIRIEKELELNEPTAHLFYTIESKTEEKLKRTEIISPRYGGIRPRGVHQAAGVISIRQRIERLINTTWLPIHRTPANRTLDPSRTFESSVDDRLDHLNTSLVRFFSELSSAADLEDKEFQKNIFAALVPSFQTQAIFQVVGELNLKEEERVLREILSDFSASPGDLALEQYFQYLRSAIKKIVEYTKKKRAQEKNLSFSFEEGGAIVMIETIHRIVRSWQELKSKRNAIFEPRESFLRILNASSWRKRYEINAKNELQILMDNSNRFSSTTNLSSGEKQLVIILGEALLQRKRPFVYIADEPELSLHVKWQEKLVSMLRDLNPQAQIIFATHSPDIVANYQNRVFDMESLIA